MSPRDPAGIGRPGDARVLADWVASFRRAPLWSALALEDLRDRYRRTVFGVVWVIVSFALFVAVKVAIFGQLSPVAPAEFGLYVVIGFGLWTYINSLVLDAASAFMQARPWILGTSTPYPVYLLQVIYRNWLVFGLIMVVVAVATAWRPAPWDASVLWTIPGLVAYAVTSLWMAMILAPLCLRWRDAHQAIQTGMRLLFFATPILWMPGASGRLSTIAQFNPITHFVEVVRQPLMYGNLPLDSWTIVLLLNLIGLPVGLLTYARTRTKLVYWV